MFRFIAILAICFVASGCASRTTLSETATLSTETPAAASPTAPNVDGAFLDDASNNRIYFQYDSWTVSDEARQVLRRQAAWLTANPSVSILVEGHCDERGTREYNLGLGERRASAVRAFLVDAGVAGERIHTTSYGKDRPEAAASNDQAWSRNRRAVTTLAR